MLYADFRRAAGIKEIELQMAEPALVQDVLAAIRERVPSLAPLTDLTTFTNGLDSPVMVLINGHIAAPGTIVQPGDELWLLPPISGG